MRPRNLALLLVVLLVLGWQAWHKGAGEPAEAGAGAPATRSSDAPPQGSARDAGAPRDEAATRDDAGVSGLPREATQVLARIRAGGPFEYERDGVVFGNFEGHLPQQPRGYYHEYTVRTPGERGRGARRIIAGGSPPGEFWYTADHYDSFVRIDAGAGEAR
jgi:guanyl-specific ribonuclease Sa